jgi:glycosyltransferase involved in cell wall biosynthesis
MNVLQLIDTLHAGGAERMAVNLANAGNSGTYRAFLCATREGGILEASVHRDVPLLIADKKSITDRKALQRILKFVRVHEIEIIHAHSTSIYTAFLVKLLRPKTKLVWHDHYGLSEFLDKRPRRKLAFIAKFMAGAIGCNLQLKAWAQSKLGIVKTLYLPNFSVPEACTLETEIGGEAGKRIVCLANLRPQKNHLQVLEVFKAFALQNTGYTLHLVGKDFKDTYSQEVRDCIQTFGLEDWVFLYGSRPDVSAILKEMDIAVLLSTSEGLPLALLEYGLAALPTVVSDVGMCKEVVGETAFIVKNVLTEAQNYLEKYAQDPFLKDAMGTAFAAKIKKEYSANESSKALYAFYKTLN